MTELREEVNEEWTKCVAAEEVPAMEVGEEEDEDEGYIDVCTLIPRTDLNINCIEVLFLSDEQRDKKLYL